MTDNRNNSNTFMHLLLGFAAGALTVFLSDEKKRDNLKKVLNQTMEKGDRVKNDLKEKMHDTVNTGKKRLARELEKTSKQMSA